MSRDHSVTDRQMMRLSPIQVAHYFLASVAMTTSDVVPIAASCIPPPSLLHPIFLSDLLVFLFF